MDNKINFQQLVEKFAQASGMSKNWSEQFVKSFFDIISERVIEEGLVKIKGFGTFKLVETENRESVNVNTGERIVIEGHQKINFIPEAELKEFINQPFASFDTIQLNDKQVSELARIDKEETEGKAKDKKKSAAVETSAAESDNSEQVKPTDSDVAKKVAAVKAMAKEAMAKEALEREAKELAESAAAKTPETKDVPAGPKSAGSQKPASQKGPDVVMVGPMLPTGEPQDREVHRLPPAVAMALKVLAWILSIIVALWVIIYAVWPAVAVAIFRDMETERKYSQASAVQQRLEYEQMMSLYDDSIQEDADSVNAVAADTITFDSMAVNVEQVVIEEKSVKPEVKEQPVAVEKPVQEKKQPVEKPVEKKPETVKNEPEKKPVAEKPVAKPAAEKPVATSKPVSNGKLVLLDVDEKRDLSEFSEADTVNYRIAGVLTEHVIQPGETLSKLALKYYGTKKLWPYIAKFNKAKMNKINTDDVIRIPVLVNR